MKPKLKITLKTKTSFCDVELAPKRAAVLIISGLCRTLPECERMDM